MGTLPIGLQEKYCICLVTCFRCVLCAQRNGEGWRLASPHPAGMQLILQEFTPKTPSSAMFSIRTMLCSSRFEFAKGKPISIWQGKEVGGNTKNKKHFQYEGLCNHMKKIDGAPWLPHIDSAVHIFNFDYGYITDRGILI